MATAPDWPQRSGSATSGAKEEQDQAQANTGSPTVTELVRPLVAVTTSEVRRHRSATPIPHGESPHGELALGLASQEEMALGLKYLQAIERAGGIPVVIPPLAGTSLEPLLANVAGVCLSGGPDLDPIAYSASRHRLTGPSWERLDRFELALARAADARRLPILAICRGLQVLNVARGGTLHQHLPDVTGERLRHRQEEPAHMTTHWVTLTPSSRLSAIFRSRRRMVNSFHHQAVATLGDRLAPTARASDGTIEGIEAVDRDFVLGVQWHAECLTERVEHVALFEAFIDAARRFDEARWRFARAA
jgi:putative glutamine amidotransferase